MRILVTRSAHVLRKVLSFNRLRVCSLSAQEIGKTIMCSNCRRGFVDCTKN